MHKAALSSDSSEVCTHPERGKHKNKIKIKINEHRVRDTSPVMVKCICIIVTMKTYRHRKVPISKQK